MPYTFDSAWETFLRVAPKFANSHYHDIMAYSCGFISFVFVSLIRKRVKSYNADRIYQKYSYDVYHHDDSALKPLMMYRISNLLIPLMAYILGVYGFFLVSKLSERIKTNTLWLPVAGLVPIAIYTIFEFLESGLLGWLFTIAIMVFISAINYRYCLLNEDHHKACYAVKYIMVTFGVIGIMKQFMPPFKTIVSLLHKKAKH